VRDTLIVLIEVVLERVQENISLDLSLSFRGISSFFIGISPTSKVAEASVHFDSKASKDDWTSCRCGNLHKAYIIDFLPASDEIKS
jgi:hypothetical protein